MSDANVSSFITWPFGLIQVRHGDLVDLKCITDALRKHNYVLGNACFQG